MNPNVSSSSLSDTSQVRYAKAIKQISKLVGVNNTIKRDLQNYRVACENYQYQNNQLFQNLQLLNEEKKQMQAKLSQSQNLVKQLEIKNANIMKKQQSLLTNSILQDQRNKHHDQILILNEKLNQQGNTIAHLEDRIAELQKENKQLNLNQQKVKKQLQLKVQEKSNKLSSFQCPKCPQNINKMNQAIEFRKIIQQQFFQMRKKQLSSPATQTYPYYQKNRQVKQHVIWSLEQKVRFLEEKYKKKNIEIYKLKSKLQRYQEEIKKYRSKLKSSNINIENRQDHL